LRISEQFAISRQSAAVAGIVLIAAALRLSGLGAQSFWHDEALTVESARVSVWQCVQTVRNGENCPPAYFVVVNLWCKLVTLSDASLRLPSALMGIASVWIVYKLGRQLFDASTALTAAALLAVWPYHIAYSQEARPYAMLMLVVALCLWAFVRLMRTGSPSAQAAYVASATAAMYTHTFALFSLTALNLFYLAQLRCKCDGKVNLRRWLILQAAVLVLFGPWIPATREVMQMGLPWMRHPTSVLQTLLTFSGGTSGLILILLLLASAACRWNRWCWLLLGLIVLPIVAPIAYGIFVPRYGIAALVGFALLGGYGAARGGAVTCIACVIGLAMLASPPPPKPDLRAVAAELTRAGADAVYLNRSEGFSNRVLDYYLAGRGPRRVDEPPPLPLPRLWLVTSDLKPLPGYAIASEHRFTAVNLLLLEPVAATQRSD
jgi:4-amino-4-deoxy-L-arabinose transferase-like glycosyltransferase